MFLSFFLNESFLHNEYVCLNKIECLSPSSLSVYKRERAVCVFGKRERESVCMCVHMYIVGDK